MNKKYIYLLLILIITLYCNTANATLSSIKQGIDDELLENLTFQKITDIISNVSSYQDEIESFLGINITEITKKLTIENNISTYYQRIGNKTTLGRIMEIIIQHNEKFTTLLQRVVQNIFIFKTLE